MAEIEYEEVLQWHSPNDLDMDDRPSTSAVPPSTLDLQLSIWDPQPSTSDAQPSTSRQILDQKTPHSAKTIYPEIRKRARSSEKGDIWTPTRLREMPLPSLTWANSAEVWQAMVFKEEATYRDRNCRLFEDPTSFLPRMRSILVDWMMEVCEVYHLRRNTFYLALDILDRYLTIYPTVPKHKLQLIGVTALFISSKLEEIYPPKLNEFSYVCDGACEDRDILDCELLLLNTLGWSLNPTTPTGWLNLYMQIYSSCRNKGETPAEFDFMVPRYSAYKFTLVSNLIDLFSLDPGYLIFSYSTIAAAAMYFYFGRGPALYVSGLHWDDLKDCTEYMAVFYATLRDTNDPRLESVVTQEVDERQDAAYESLKIPVSELTVDEGYTMQTHIINLEYFEKAILLRLERMGLSVRKTAVKKRRSPERKFSVTYGCQSEALNEVGPVVTNGYGAEASNECMPDEIQDIISDTDESDNDTSGEEDKSVVIFEIEKLPSPSNSMENENEVEDENIQYFTSKKKFTFDDILRGIHTCTSKTLPRRLNAHPPSFEIN